MTDTSRNDPSRHQAPGASSRLMTEATRAGQGRGQRVRGRGDEAVAQGEAEGLDRRGGPLAAAGVGASPRL